MIPYEVLVGVAIGVAVVASAALSRRTGIPEPGYLVLAGLVVSFVPGIEAIRLPPEVVFYGFLPPLLYAAAFLTAPREVRANWLSILLFAVGLTAATLFAVSAVAWIAIGHSVPVPRFCSASSSLPRIRSPCACRKLGTGLLSLAPARCRRVRFSGGGFGWCGV
jgi:NhaP-type Na+/H+ or K+/H+ antiporter